MYRINSTIFFVKFSMVSGRSTMQAGDTCRHRCKPADDVCRRAGGTGLAGQRMQAGGASVRLGLRLTGARARVRAEHAGVAGRGWPTARGGAGRRRAARARRGVREVEED
jgi:hypothetical protein